MTQLTGMIKRWWVALIFGVVAILLGIYMLFNPIETYIALSYIFALYFIVYGIYKIYVTYKEREEIPAWGWSLALGIITTILGLLLLLPGMATSTFVYYVAFAVLFMGINTSISAFALKDMGDSYWGWSLGFGILTAILAVLMMFMPVLSAGLISYWFGALFIVLGIQLCIVAYRLSVLKGQMKRDKEAMSH